MVVLQQDEVLNELRPVNENEFGQLVDEDSLSSQISLTNKLLNVMHLNIRSISKNFDNLLLLIEQFNLFYCDVIVLSECFKIASAGQYGVPGYDTFHNGGNYNKNDGVVILVRSTVSAEISHSKLPVSGATVSRIVFIIDGVSIGVTAAYKPPPIPVQDFVDDIHSFLDTNVSNDIEVFTGDVNIDILKTADNNVCEYLFTMAQLGFVPYINSPTRFQSRSCLDHIFVLQRLHTIKFGFSSYVIDTHITDHAPVMINITSNSPLPDNFSQNSGIIKKKKLDLDKFRKLLNLENWSCVTSISDPDLATNVFISTYKELMLKAEVEYTVKINKHRKIKKWITNGLIKSIKYRDKLKRRLIKSYSPELEAEYKVYRNYLNKLVNKQKNNYYRSEVNKNRKDLKKVYGIIRDATNECKSIKSILKLTRDDNKQFESELEMANYCNDFFVNIGVHMNERVPLPGNHLDMHVYNSSSMFLKPLTETEIIGHISSLRSDSAPGHDKITVNIIKQTHMEILKPLLHIINLSFEVGRVPTHFKTSVIIPVHKSGAKTNISNYRPISLISNFAKIFEKSLKNRIVDHFKTNNIISSNQFGFTEGLSTGDAMYKLVSEITSNMNLGRKCIGVFLDLAKAFDTVPHDRVLEVLSSCGVRGVVLQLMESYLIDRYQCLRLNDCLSELQKVKIGIPQGTVVGPILFIMYINSLLKMDVGGLSLSYADDTALVFSGKDWEEAKRIAEAGLCGVKNWLETYKLTLNIGKTNYVAFSLTNANRPIFTSIRIGDDKIGQVHEVKYLGIVIDEFLKWSPHIDFISNKVRRLIHKFYLLREFLSRGVLVLIYKALIESIIRYGIVAWGGLYSSALHKLEILQKYFLKIIFRRSRIYPTELLYTIDTPNIRVIYMTTLCSYLHNHGRMYVDHSHKTRSNTNRHLKIPLNHNNLNLRFADYIAPKVYNLLPISVRNLRVLKKFNIESKKYIFENYNNVFRVIVK